MGLAKVATEFLCLSITMQTVQYLQEMYTDCFPKGTDGYYINYPYGETMQKIKQWLKTRIYENGIVLIIMECLQISHDCNRCNTQYCDCNNKVCNFGGNGYIYCLRDKIFRA